MNLHQSDLTARLKRFLERRSIPRALENKPTAIADEVRALVAAIGRYAPQAPALSDWWDAFEARLGEGNVTRAWPTEGEIKAAAMAGKKSERIDASGSFELDSAAIWAKRMLAGEPVGDDCFYGGMAIEMLNRGLVSMNDIRPYRSAMYFSRKEFYGEVVAREKENADIDRHSYSEQVARERAANPARNQDAA